MASVVRAVRPLEEPRSARRRIIVTVLWSWLIVSVVLGLAAWRFSEARVDHFSERMPLLTWMGAVGVMFAPAAGFALVLAAGVGAGRWGSRIVAAVSGAGLVVALYTCVVLQAWIQVYAGERYFPSCSPSERGSFIAIGVIGIGMASAVMVMVRDLVLPRSEEGRTRLGRAVVVSSVTVALFAGAALELTFLAAQPPPC
jgi:hypothetical protein